MKVILITINDDVIQQEMKISALKWNILIIYLFIYDYYFFIVEFSSLSRIIQASKCLKRIISSCDNKS